MNARSKSNNELSLLSLSGEKELLTDIPETSSTFQARTASQTTVTAIDTAMPGGVDSVPHPEQNYTSNPGSNASEEDRMAVDSILTARPFSDGCHDDTTDHDLSDGDDLHYDLECALGGDIDFKGSFAYGASVPHAPNPCLHIGGLGILGLPLSDRDAKHIESSIQRRGHDDKSSSDKQIGDAWEIEPARISFANPAWDRFISDTVKTVCKELGVASSGTPPRCELHKLILYQLGSQLLPQEETEKIDEMFATIVILLPSCYTGGQILISHDATTTVFDFATDSLLTTCTMGWYTGVVHQMKTITSGYQVALAYNLIHASPDIPRPRLPNIIAARAELRTVLRKWSKGKYQPDPSIKIIACLFKHEYKGDSLTIKTLRREDANKVSRIRSVAVELGYVVGFAKLEYKMTGYAAETGRWVCDDDEDDDDDDGDTPSMSEMTETHLTINSLVDLNGVQILPIKELPLKAENLIPEDPFEFVDPDDTDYEGYGSALVYWYYRPVLILFHKDDRLNLLLSARGVRYALKRIKKNKSQERTEENVRMVEYILQHADVSFHEDTLVLLSVSEYALQWKDPETWKRAVEKADADRSISVFGINNLLEACRTFSFEVVRPVMEKLLAHAFDLGTQVGLLESLHGLSGHENIIKWCREQTTTILMSLNTPPSGEMIALKSIVLLEGLSIVEDVILPQWGKAPRTFDFWVDFIEMLHKNKATLRESPQSSPEAEESSSAPDDPDSDDEDDESPAQGLSTFDYVIGQCFNAAIRQWDTVPAPPKPKKTRHPLAKKPNPDQPVVSRVIRLIDLCITTSNVAACTRLVLVVVRSKGEFEKKFRTLYDPLIPQLHDVLKKHRVDVCSRPFGHLMRILIGMYMSTVLGAKPRQSGTNIRNIGCGCKDCVGLDNFIQNTEDVDVKFHFSQQRRMHLERQVLRATDLVTFQTVRSSVPHALVITKRAEPVATIQWQKRVDSANKFLSKIGNDQVIAKIMGPRYADVEKALEGTRLYVMNVATANAEQQRSTSEIASSNVGLSTHSTSIQRSHSPSSTTSASALKRKRDDETPTAPIAARGITEAKPVNHEVPANQSGNHSCTAVNSLQPPASSSIPVISAPRSRTPDVPKMTWTTKPAILQERRSPRKLGLASRVDEVDRPIPVKKQNEKASASSSSSTSGVRQKPKGPNVERLNSESTRNKRKRGPYNFVGPVIDLTADD